MKIYLAGPEVFSPNPQKEGHRLKEICRNHGCKGIFPLDDGPNLDGLEPEEIAEEIFDANLKKIDDCDAVIANMSPFRGPGMDGGTAFEVGYAYARGKIIVGWSSDDREYIDRARDHFDGAVKKTDRWRDPDGWEVEDLGLPDNLMMSCATIEVVSDFESALKLLLAVFKEAKTQGLDWS